jgi:hypothetical protein
VLEQFPVWFLCVAVIAVVALALRAGILVAQRVRRRSAAADLASEGIGAVVGAVLGLLAFMMAITFGMAADRRDSRRALLLEEVNSIGTTYLRAGLIPEAQRDASRAIFAPVCRLAPGRDRTPRQFQSRDRGVEQTPRAA